VRARLPRVLALATAGVWIASISTFVAFFFALDAAQNVWRFSRNEDGLLVGALGGFWLAAALSLACAVVTARERMLAPVSRVRRLARVLPALAFVALTWFAWNWGLLSNPLRY
jgi:hypothetical protein